MNEIVSLQLLRLHVVVLIPSDHKHIAILWSHVESYDFSPKIFVAISHLVDPMRGEFDTTTHMQGEVDGLPGAKVISVHDHSPLMIFAFPCIAVIDFDGKALS
jgi:hypothetical protein